MSKSLVFVLAFLCLAAACLGSEAAAPDPPEPLRAVELTPPPSPVRALPGQKSVPPWNFSVNPNPIINNYYDYMIGGYNNLPLNLVPESQGGGYFLTWTGRNSPTSDRKSYYGYLYSSGMPIFVNQIVTQGEGEHGMPALVVDPVDGNPFYAWTQNVDTDPVSEIVLTSDAFIAGIAGLFNTTQIVIDNPVTLTAPDGTETTNNVFYWPSLAIGPSPLAGKRRLYLLGRQNCNVYLAMADFSRDDVENGIPLNWQYSSVPQLNTWELNAVPNKTYLALETDSGGNVILAGYHNSYSIENDIIVFICGNFGQGEWTFHSFNSRMPTWNPTYPGSNGGFFIDDEGQPFQDQDLHWKLLNSGHLNATLDSGGRLHIVGIWALAGGDGVFFPHFQFVKEAVYDPTWNNFEIRDIFPQKNSGDLFNACFTPWDMLPPYGEVDEWIYDEEYGYYPYTFTDWPFPHWDQAAHENTMMFHYNNVKITRANDYGQMAVVWQDSKRAFDWYVYHYPGYEAWEHGTDIYIAYTNYCGSEWQDPIVLNNVDTPELADIKPMWVYPADRMIFTGFNHYGFKEGKLGLMFYDDFTWGSNSLPPPYHPDPDGGRVMFMELHIGYLDANDPSQAPAPAILAQNWPNPFNPNTNISFELPQPGPARLEIFDLRGRLVSTLLDKEMGAGKHSLNWDGTDSNGAQLASGVYIYRLSTGRTSASRKMILLK